MRGNNRQSTVLGLLLLLALATVLTAAFSWLVSTTPVSAADTGWKYPVSESATNAGSGGNGFELNPADACADDGMSAENNGGLGDSHLFYDFGLSVPESATIEGMQVRLDWFLDSDNGTNAMSVDLSWDGGTSWTSAATDNVETTVENTSYLGGSGHLWGRSWTPDELANGNFRVRITCISDTPGRVFYLEYVAVVAYYAPVDHLEVTGNSSMTAGGSNVLTITARDTLGGIAVNYRGAKSITFSGPGQAPDGENPTVGGLIIGTTVSVAFTNGVSDNPTATTLVAFRAESATVDVSDGTINSNGNPAHDLDLTMNPASASRLEVAGSGTMTAGTTNELTITTKDLYGNVATSYSGPKSLTFSGPGNAPDGQIPNVETVNIGYSTSVTFTSGVSSAGVATLIAHRAESTTVDVSDGTIDSAGSSAYDLNLTVSPASASRLEVTGSGAMTAGTTNDLTITAKDLYGNVATSYSGPKPLTFSGPATAPGGQVPAVEAVSIGASTSVTFASGISSAGAATLVTYRAESTTVDVSNGTINSNGNPAYDLDLTVGPTSTSRIDLTPNGGSATAGSPFTVTVTAYDVYSNVATGYLGTVHFASSDPIASLPGNYTFAAPDGGSHAFAVSLNTSGSRTVTVTDTGNGSLTDTDTWAVSSATSAASIAITPGGGSATAGSPFTITVTAHDLYGNVATGYLGTVHFTSSDNNAILPVDYSFAASDNGSHTFASAITLRTSGQKTITVTDKVNGALTNTATWSVSPAAPASIAITPSGGSAAAGLPFTVTVTAFDNYTNIATGYFGTVHFTSSDNSSSLPADYAFAASDNGTHLFLSAVTLRVSGQQTVTVTDNVNTALTHTTTWTVSPTGTATSIAITPSGGVATAGSPFTITVTAFDNFSNVAIGYLGTVHFTSSDLNATLPGDYTFLASDNGTHTFTGAITLRTSGIQTVTVTDSTNLALTNTQNRSVSPAAIDHYTVTSVSYTQTAGVRFSVTVTACDFFGNVVTADNSTSVTMSSNPAGMVFDANSDGTYGDNSKILTNGTFNITAMDTAAATGVTIAATDGSKTGTSSAYTISAETTIHHYTVTSTSYIQTAGVPFTVTVTAYDSFGNMVNDSSTSVTMSTEPAGMVFDANGDGTYGDNSKIITNGTFNITAMDTAAATGVTIAATDGSQTGTSSAYTISAETTIHHHTVTSTSYIQTAGAPFTVTVTAYDSFGNIVNDSSTSVTISTEPAGMVFDADGNGTYDDASKTLSNGIASFTAKDTIAAAGITISATGGSISGSSSPYTIVAGAIDHYTVTSDSYAQRVTVAFTVTVTAYDEFGNQAAADNLSMAMTSTLPSMVFDGNGNGTFGEAGDEIGVLIGGTFDIQAKARGTAEDTTIAATDGTLTATSDPYTIEDFRCFIATAAYGTPMVDQIQVLRDFRDKYLKTNPAGRLFVSTYYRCSPPLARFIARHDSLRAAVRALLTPVIWLTTLIMDTTPLQKIAVFSLVAALAAAIAFWLRRPRRSSTV